MRRVWLILFCFLIIQSTGAYPQIEEEYTPIPPSKPSTGKIGGGGGYTPGWLFMDVDKLNETIISAGGTPFDGGRMMLNGGQGYAYLLLVQNLRIGGIGMSGTRTTSRVETATNTRRDVELGVGYGGVTLEYALSVVPRLDVTFGTVIGGGSMSLTIRRANGTSKDWGDIWGEFGSPQPASEFSRKLEGSFFILQPSVTMEFALLRWLGVRAGVGYLGMTGGSWKLDDEYDLAGVPDGIGASGWMINTGIYLGTFIY